MDVENMRKNRRDMPHMSEFILKLFKVENFKIFLLLFFVNWNIHFKKNVWFATYFFCCLSCLTVFLLSFHFLFWYLSPHFYFLHLFLPISVSLLSIHISTSSPIYSE